MRVASVDIGSNSSLMLVADRDPGAPGGWRRIEDHATITRLSEGLDQSGVLASAPIERTGAQLAAFRARAAVLGVDRVLATGTAPFRRSDNGEDVAGVLAQALGAPIDVVSGAREAELSLLATRRSFPEFEEMLVVDIGGASTELIHSRPGGGAAMESLDIGSVRLTERFVTAHPIAAAEAAALCETVRSELARPEVAAMLGRGISVVGIAGTVTTLVTVSLAMAEYDDTVVHGARLSRETVSGLARSLSAMDMPARLAVPGLPEKRADVLPAGALLLGELLAAAAVDELIVSDRGTRWGRLYADG